MDLEMKQFLVVGGYASAEDWMRDSDYLYVEDSFGDGTNEPGWVDLDHNPVGDPEGCIEGAMEASEFEIDWKVEYEKAITTLASVRNSYKSALRALWGGSTEFPDSDYLTLNISSQAINRGIDLLGWRGDVEEPR